MGGWVSEREREMKEIEETLRHLKHSSTPPNNHQTTPADKAIAPEVPVERCRVELREAVHAAHLAVDAVGHGNVDEPCFRWEGQKDGGERAESQKESSTKKMAR